MKTKRLRGFADRAGPVAISKDSKLFDPRTSPTHMCSCCESYRSDHNKLAKKTEDIENLTMEMESEASARTELDVASKELTNNFDTISRFKEDVARFLVTARSLDKIVVDLPAPSCILIHVYAC
jgi:hypothetical protein